MTDGVEDNLNDYPDFQGDSKDTDVLILYLLLCNPFEKLYNKYKGKSMDYILSHVDDDVKKIRSNGEGHINKLDEVYANKRIETLKNAGILDENMGKIKDISNDSLKTLKKEYHQTFNNICDEFNGQIKSGIYFYKDTKTIDDFTVDSYFKKVINRLKKQCEFDVLSAKNQALIDSYTFLYGNPMVYWVTADLDTTCSLCRRLESESPKRMSDFPKPPIHVNCYCEICVAPDEQLTDEADKLRYYDVGD